MTHEFAHIARCDWLTKLLAQLVCAGFWLLPLSWWAARKLEWFAELACDDRVLVGRDCRAEYAEDLLEISGDCSHPAFALGFNQGSHIFRRIAAVLDGGRVRTAPGWFHKTLLILALLALAIPVAILEARVQVVEPVVDNRQRIYPLLIIDPQPVKSHPDDETDRSTYPGSHTDLMTIVRPETPPSQRPLEEVRLRIPAPVKTDLHVESDSLSNANLHPRVSIQGYVPVSTLLPRYPRSALARGIEGEVTVEFDVDANGRVMSPRIIASRPRNVFDREVLQAVNQFQFLPLQIDGQSIIIKNVTERFVFSLAPATTDIQP